MMIYRRDRYGRGGDHIPFLERGYPAVRFTKVEEFRHSIRTYGSRMACSLATCRSLSILVTANVARVNAASLASRVGAFTTEGRDDRGAAVVERHRAALGCEWRSLILAGYEIVARDDRRRLDQHETVGNVIEFTMKGRSKDNYFFGVRSIDKDGNKSP